MLSNKGKYGLKALMYMARFDGPCLAAEIAAQNQIPRKFLDAILLELRNAGILSSKKGKGGGYRLARGPETISIGSVMALILDRTSIAALSTRGNRDKLALR